ncbi:MAG: pyruvate carboxylase, partial [Roseibium sp.]
KDMAGLLKPAQARALVKALKSEVGLPIHFHTHDTAGSATATILAASEAGVDAVDCAMDALSGNTSQATLGTVVSALQHTDRDTGIDMKAVREISDYWEEVRGHYAAFETGMQAPSSEVYLHEMPGGQFTNLKAQAASMGLEDRWPEVARTYADVNQMFGDIVKVTPSSKVVGDMALMMVASELTVADVMDPDKDVAFPESVIDMLAGNLGQPPGGWPEAIQKKALKGAAPITDVPGSLLPPADLDAERATAEEEIGRKISDQELASYLMYPKVFVEYARTQETYGPTSVLPTPTYFYGMETQEDITFDLEKGKTLVLSCRAFGETDENGDKKVFFDLNGQPRNSKVPDRAHGAAGSKTRAKSELGNSLHVGAPMPGVISTLAVKEGQK